MQRFQGLIGIVLILGIAWLASNNKKKINYRLVISGISLQILIAILILKVPPVKNLFAWLGRQIGHIEEFAKAGADFVYGGVMTDNHTGGSVSYSTPGTFIFGFSVLATIILVCALVAVFYHFGIMQRIVAVIAKAMNFIMKVSGAEALSNVASAFVGQIEAQIMIRPYLSGMTMSELLASMSGSLACIAGGILIVYVNFGAKAEYLLTASIMAAPAALVISKIVWPETEQSQTMGSVKLEVKSPYRNVIDAISHGAGDGFKIALNVIAMLIGFIAVIAMLNFLLGKIGGWIHLDFPLSLEWIFGKLFYPFAWAMGVPSHDINGVATLLGEKITINEFVAFSHLTHNYVQMNPVTHLPIIDAVTKTPVSVFSEKGLMIVSFAICGFANFSSVGMQIGGIGELAPERKADLARLGMKALLCGTLASYLSATIAEY
ncbi:MAG: nucleoside transporter C-terminal domain-containing protein [Ferruginibacter sp.]